MASPHPLHKFPETTTETLLRGDIRTEIERTKTVTSCTDSTTPTDTNHLTHAAVISLYEKMTGIFITGVRFEGDPQVPGGPINYQCVYTQPSDAGAKSDHTFCIDAIMDPDTISQPSSFSCGVGRKLVETARKQNTSDIPLLTWMKNRHLSLRDDLSSWGPHSYSREVRPMCLSGNLKNVLPRRQRKRPRSLKCCRTDKLIL